MLANEVINLTLDGSIQPLSYQAGVSQVETATVVGTITGDGNATVVTTAASVTGSPITTSVAVDDGTAQVETATAAGAITGTGNATVVVTAAGMTGSPKTVSVAVTNGDSAATWAGLVRAALTADADVGHATTGFFTVSGSSTSIILTARTKAANDATLNISLDNGTCTGITTAATSANTTAGVAPDTASGVATKIRAALNLEAAITAVYTIGGSGANITLTRTTPAATDNTLNLSIANGTCTGLTDALYSVQTTAGVAPGALGTFTPRFIIRNPIGSAGNMLIGHTNSSNTIPATLTSANCLYELVPGDSVEIGEDNRSYWIGENYILSHWFVKGTASDVCKVTYVTRRTAATPS